jgi:uncharacterized protein YndB with AHSA1/START domain
VSSSVTGTTTVSRALEVTVNVDSTIQELYCYLTNDKLLSHWLCAKAETAPTKGGKFALWLDDENKAKPDVEGKFMNVVENKTVQYAWVDSKRKIRSLVTVVLTQKEDRVRIDLYHTSLPMDKEYDQTYYDYARFWKAKFDRLIEHLSS